MSDWGVFLLEWSCYAIVCICALIPMNENAGCPSNLQPFVNQNDDIAFSAVVVGTIGMAGYLGFLWVENWLGGVSAYFVWMWGQEGKRARSRGP